MIKLDKKEKILWSTEEAYIHKDGKDLDVDIFALTDKNIRINYFYKISFFKKEYKELIIPLTEIEGKKIHTVNEGTSIILLIGDVYKLKLKFESEKIAIKEINRFIERLKKNINFDHEKGFKHNEVSEYNNEVNSFTEFSKINDFLLSLGTSKVSLVTPNINKMQKSFPIPFEQKILWADCEFDSRSSGVVCTNKGCFIKTNSKALDELKNKENKKAAKLFFFKWDSFDPSVFVHDNDSNVLLKVDERCIPTFISSCETFFAMNIQEQNEIIKKDESKIKNFNSIEVGAIAATVFVDNNNTEFIGKHIRNETGRHGFFAEHANNIIDKIKFKNTEVVGTDNATNGADRRIRSSSGDIFIQTKYHKTAARSVDSAFGSDGYRYYDNNNNPMQLEVPRDQYHDAILEFEIKILQGKVLDSNGNVINDIDYAKEIVRKGNITYQQSVNIAKAGNIDSIKYDIVNGIVNCSFAFGISFITTFYFSFRRNNNITESIRDSLKVGATVFGLAMFNHVLISQLYRTKMFIDFTGDVILRDALIGFALPLIIYSIPNIVKFISNEISLNQMVKNTALLASSMGLGALSAQVGKKIGSKFGVVGSITGAIAGGVVGSIAGSAVVKKVMDVIIEDDIQVFMRIYNAVIASNVVDYMLDSDETEELSKSLMIIDSKIIKNLNSNYRKSARQELVIDKFLAPYFESIVNKRIKVQEPAIVDILKTSFSY